MKLMQNLKGKIVVPLALAAALSACGGNATSQPETPIAPTTTVVQQVEDPSTPTTTVAPEPVEQGTSLESLVINGSAVTQNPEGTYLLPGTVNPGDELHVQVEITGSERGTFEILGKRVPYSAGADTITTTVSVPDDLTAPTIMMYLGEEGEARLGFQPGEAWAPNVSVESPTGLTGDVTLEVRVSDLNGNDTVESLAVQQMFNFQVEEHAQEIIDDADSTLVSYDIIDGGIGVVTFEDPAYNFEFTTMKDIDQYVSNNSLAPITVTEKEPGVYDVSFSSEWPGRFILRMAASDADGNTTYRGVPVEVYWAEQPFEVRGAMIEGWTPRGPAHLSDENLVDTIERLAETNVNYISLNPIWYLHDKNSSEFIRAPSEWSGGPFTSITDTQMERLIELATEYDIDVMIKPMVFVGDYHWIGNVNLSEEWFENYGSQVLLPMAVFAADNDVAMLSIFNDSADQNAYQEEMTNLTEKVREVYSGDLTIADGQFPDKYMTHQPVTFTDSLDVYGFQSYLPGSGHPFYPTIEGDRDPTVDEMVENMDDHYDDQEHVVISKEMTALATELGIMNADGANRSPGGLDYDMENWAVDNQEQVDYMEAAFRASSERDWIDGAFIWATSLGEIIYEDEGLGITADVKDKPVEDMLRIWYYVPPKG